jgi:hypothetical protein
MKPKYLLLLVSFFVVSAGARAGTVDQDGVVRDNHANPLLMNQADAMKACAGHGMHLPTIRELAKISQSMGAKGILEKSEVQEGKVPAGFYLVIAIDPNGKKDEFYFNYSGYNRPAGDLGNNWFWSSSVVSDVSYNGYGLDGYVGDVYVPYDPRVPYSAVRCVAGQ